MCLYMPLLEMARVTVMKVELSWCNEDDMQYGIPIMLFGRYFSCLDRDWDVINRAACDQKYGQVLAPMM